MATMSEKLRAELEFGGRMDLIIQANAAADLMDEMAKVLGAVQDDEGFRHLSLGTLMAIGDALALSRARGDK